LNFDYYFRFKEYEDNEDFYLTISLIAYGKEQYIPDEYYIDIGVEPPIRPEDIVEESAILKMAAL